MMRQTVSSSKRNQLLDDDARQIREIESIQQLDLSGKEAAKAKEVQEASRAIRRPLSARRRYFHAEAGRALLAAGKFDDLRKSLAKVQADLAQAKPTAQPEPPQGKQPVAQSGRVKLFERDESPTIDDVPQRRLSEVRYDMVFALINGGKNGLGKDDLITNSNHGVTWQLQEPQKDRRLGQTRSSLLERPAGGIASNNRPPFRSPTAHLLCTTATADLA